MHKYTSVSVAGASGYSGAEAVRLLARHPQFRLNHVYSGSNAGSLIADVVPALAGVVDRTLQDMALLSADDSELLLLALPPSEALALVPELAGSRRIVDLSGDFRLRDVAAYHRYYGQAHTATEHLANAAYGLTELFSDHIAGAGLVANPGCYATASGLALAPLAHARLLPATCSIVAFSGLSGAGRVPSPNTHFAEVNESVRAYKVGVHQHTPEIEQSLSAIAGTPIRVAFIPHLLPVTRGIQITIALPLSSHIRPVDAIDLYEKYYAGKPFVRLRSEPPAMKDVLHTNFCDIHVAYDAHAGMLIVLATIDNLMKGAAGQAVQNMNLMVGLDQRTGLI